MMKYILLLMMLLFPVISYSQTLVEYKGDTVIAITPEDLVKINTLFVSYDFLKRELGIYKTLYSNNASLLIMKDSLLSIKDDMIEKQTRYYEDFTNNLQETLKREKKKRKTTTTLLSGAIVVLGVMVLCK